MKFVRILAFILMSFLTVSAFAQDTFKVRDAAVQFVIEESQGHFDMEEFYHPFLEESSVLSKKEAKKYKEFWVNMSKFTYVKIPLHDCGYSEAIVVVDKKTEKALRAFYIE